RGVQSRRLRTSTENEGGETRSAVGSLGIERNRPRDNSPEGGQTTATAGGVLSTRTPILTVVLLPAPSVAVTASVCIPSARTSVSSENSYGAEISVEKDIPSTKSSTRATPVPGDPGTLSVPATSKSITPRTAAPEAGETIVTCGGVVSMRATIESL